jgi:hypothetical protein
MSTSVLAGRTAFRTTSTSVSTSFSMLSWLGRMMNAVAGHVDCQAIKYRLYRAAAAVASTPRPTFNCDMELKCCHTVTAGCSSCCRCDN